MITSRLAEKLGGHSAIKVGPYRYEVPLLAKSWGFFPTQPQHSNHPVLVGIPGLHRQSQSRLSCTPARLTYAPPIRSNVVIFPRAADSSFAADEHIVLRFIHLLQNT